MAQRDGGKVSTPSPAGARPTNPGPFDLAHLQRMTHGDRALAREVLRLFDGQSERQLGAIEAAADATARAAAAHALKGAARGVGAFAVADAAEAVEGADAARLTPALLRLRQSVADARRALPSLLRD
jgi:HPt (histidine-containing phosphotransfer) domain-containing protein